MAHVMVMPKARVLLGRRSQGAQIVAARPPGHHFDDVALFHANFHSLFAIPIVVFGFNCHTNVVTIMMCAALLLCCLTIARSGCNAWSAAAAGTAG